VTRQAPGTTVRAGVSRAGACGCASPVPRLLLPLSGCQGRTSSLRCGRSTLTSARRGSKRPAPITATHQTATAGGLPPAATLSPPRQPSPTPRRPASQHADAGPCPPGRSPAAVPPTAGNRPPSPVLRDGPRRRPRAGPAGAGPSPPADTSPPADRDRPQVSGSPDSRIPRPPGRLDQAGPAAQAHALAAAEPHRAAASTGAEPLQHHTRSQPAPVPVPPGQPAGLAPSRSRPVRAVPSPAGTVPGGRRAVRPAGQLGSSLLASYVEDLVATAPPLTGEQRDKLALLLRTSPARPASDRTAPGWRSAA
jgi:hypothetical protein